MTITRYDFTDTGLEPTGQGEWVAYADYASHIEAANLRHAAALEAVARARDDAWNEFAALADKIGNHCVSCGHVCGDPEKDLAILRKAGARSCCPEREIEPLSATILALRTQPTPSVEPMTVQQAALLLWQADDGIGPYGSCLGHGWTPGMATKLRAIAGGRNE